MAKTKWAFGTYEVIETDEAPFVPGQPVVKAILEPEKPEQPYVPPAEPTPPPIAPPPYIPERPKEMPVIIERAPMPVVVDIETTGADPLESRITVICAVDVLEPDNIRVFFDVDEEKMVKEFIRWFENKGFNEIIGYYVGFDYRFIFSRMLKYRIQSKAFAEADLYDIAQVLAQVKQAFVYGTFKPGSLNEWAEYLLGITKLATGEDAILMWEQKRYDDLIEYCKKDVEIELLLFALIEYCSGRI